MGVFDIAITIITLIGLAWSEAEVLSIELSLPDIIATFNSLQQALGMGSDINLDSKKPAENLFMKIKWDGLDNIASILNQLRRDNQMRPNVELGPGAFKSEIVTYPPNYFVNRLKTLLKIKEKEEERNKDLNAPQ